MALSSSSLFHFTKGGIETLKAILSDGFRINYSLEIHPKEYVDSTMYSKNVLNPHLTTNYEPDGSKSPQEYVNIKIPMTCFCDIPLSSAKSHSEKYGAYAIGLTKEWAVKNGINPVFYVARNSMVAKEFWQKMNLTTTRKASEVYNIPLQSGEKMELKLFGYNSDTEEIIDDHGFIYPVYSLYLKPVGEQVNNPQTSTYANYQDEKEWRYIPDRPYILRHIKTDRRLWDRMYYQKFLRNYQMSSKEREPKYANLAFDLDDITFIIVKQDIEIPIVLDLLLEKYKTNSDNLIDPKLAMAISKIISFERIEKDIFNV